MCSYHRRLLSDATACPILADPLVSNAGISTDFWVATNRKRPERRGKVHLVNAREGFVKLRKSLGKKRKEIRAKQIAEARASTATSTEATG